MENESKTIKISKENYLWLLKLAAEIQKEYHRPVSFDATLNSLRNGKMEKKKLSDLAGKWKMSDKEAKEFMKNAKKGWKKWKIPSF